MEKKKAIRKQIFELRKEVPDDEILKKSRRIMEKVLNLKAWKEASCVYAYMDFNKEVMTRELIETAWKQGKQVAVPKVQGEEMVFYYITDFNQFEISNYGILEPVEGSPVADCRDALMIVPGVAFDKERHRIGYGGGFYDKFLSVHKDLYTAAVAFSWQLVSEVPCEPTDIQPECLITENEIYMKA